MSQYQEDVPHLQPRMITPTQTYTHIFFPSYFFSPKTVLFILTNIVQFSYAHMFTGLCLSFNTGSSASEEQVQFSRSVMSDSL